MKFLSAVTNSPPGRSLRHSLRAPELLASFQVEQLDERTVVAPACHAHLLAFEAHRHNLVVFVPVDLAETGAPHCPPCLSRLGIEAGDLNSSVQVAAVSVGEQIAFGHVDEDRSEEPSSDVRTVVGMDGPDLLADVGD